MTIPAGITVTTRPGGAKAYLLGSVFAAVPVADVGPYVTADGVAVPHQGWFQIALDRTHAAPLTIVQTPAQLVAAHRAFPMGNTGIPFETYTAPAPFKGPMDSSTVIKGMTQTGGASDRGLVTDEVGHFMRTDDQSGMLTWAQVADSIPINVIDAATGKPIDLLKNPLANCYNNVLQPYFPKGPNGVPADGWVPSTDHFPSLTYHAFEATHDMNFLYNLQFAAISASTESAYWSSQAKRAIIGQGQTRQLAWGFRLLFEAHAATEHAEALGILPSDLHPSSYFKGLLDNNLSFYSAQMADPTRQTFRLIGPDLWFGMWQVDYLLSALAFGVLTGHSDWTPLYLWALGNVIARTSGQSGWPPAACCVYYTDDVPGGSNPALPRFSWAEAFDDEMVMPLELMPKATHDALIADPMNGGNLMMSVTKDVLFTGCRAVVILADYLDKIGKAGVRAMYPEFDTCLANIETFSASYAKSPGGLMQERFAFVSIPSTSPPAGALHMSTTGNFNVGDPVHINLTFDDGHGNPSQAPVNLAYVVTPPGAVANLVENAAGVSGTAALSGAFEVDATADNCAPAKISGAIALPLAASLHLAWG